MSRPFVMWFVTATRRPDNPNIRWETLRAFASNNVFDSLLVYGALCGANQLRSIGLVRLDQAGSLYLQRTYLQPQNDPAYWETSEGQFEGVDCHCGTARNWMERYQETQAQEVHPWIFQTMPAMRGIFLQNGIDPGTIGASVPAVVDGHAPEGHGAHT